MRSVRRPRVAACAAVLAVGVIVGGGAPAMADFDPNGVEGGLWYYTRTGLAEAHQLTTGEGITIAVLDTVINPDAPDLVGANLEVRPACRRDDGTMWPATSTGPDAEHGTGVTALIAGTGTGVAGQAGIQGVAPGARVIHFAIAQPGWEKGAGVGTLDCPIYTASGDWLDPEWRDEITTAVDEAIAAGADIITTSIGNTAWASDYNARALLRAYEAGVLVVAAPANEVIEGGRLTYPAGLNGVLAVGRHDIDGALPDRLAPNGPYLGVVAPGVGVLTPSSQENWTRYWLMEGTSYAAPWTAGVLALAWSLHPEATANQMMQALIRTTATAPENGDPVHDDYWGYGPVSVPRLLAVDPTTLPDENPFLRPLDDPEAIPTTAEILQATGKAVPEPEPTETAPATPTPQDTDEPAADTDEGTDTTTILLVAALVGTALLLTAAVIIAVILRRRTTTPTPAAGAYPTGGGS